MSSVHGTTPAKESNSGHTAVNVELEPDAVDSREDVQESQKEKHSASRKLKLVVEKGEKQKNDNGSQKGDKRLRRFPCCFHIPLDIAMEGFALIDIIYYSLFCLAWAILIALEPFSGRDPTVPRNGTLGVEYEKALEQLLESMATTPNPEDKFYAESTTTIGPVFFSPEKYDYEKLARIYSKIAYRLRDQEQEIDDHCGRDYYKSYLFTNQLDITRRLFEHISQEIINACMFYVFIGIFLLTTICCFRGYIVSKMFIIILCYAQLIPSYIMMKAIILTQSQRICIIQYGLKGFTRGQDLLFWLLLGPLITYKPYEIFIWLNYIKLYFQNKDGVLLDESYFCAAKTEARQRRLAALALLDSFDSRVKGVGRSQIFRKVVSRHHKSTHLARLAGNIGDSKPEFDSSSSE